MQSVLCVRQPKEIITNVNNSLITSIAMEIIFSVLDVQMNALDVFTLFNIIFFTLNVRQSSWINETTFDALHVMDSIHWTNNVLCIFSFRFFFFVHKWNDANGFEEKLYFLQKKSGKLMNSIIRKTDKVKWNLRKSFTRKKKKTKLFSS